MAAPAGLVNQLTAEVGMLRHQLVVTATQGGTHIPMAPPLPGQYPYGPAPMPMGMPPATQAPIPKVCSVLNCRTCLHAICKDAMLWTCL